MQGIASGHTACRCNAARASKANASTSISIGNSLRGQILQDMQRHAMVTSKANFNCPF